MAKGFTECNGLEIVGGETGHLVISEEELSPAPLKVTFPVMVYTPNMNKVTECHHIELTNDEALTLHAWLGDYLGKIGFAP